MASIVEPDNLVDSGFASSGIGSSDICSPEVKSILLPDDEEDEEDESLSERLIGLMEMFPEDVRNWGYSIGSHVCTSIKRLYSFSCSATWFFFSSSTILLAPIVLEVERAQVKEMEIAHQKQVLLGPNAAMSNLGSAGLPMAPPVQR